ncbi:RecB family exonuclease [Chitiniphilus eburneus]|uniref:PD-(D/E)XK nuclease family protein n=1 Tax=Chitiniphilus eburneus TaxID=2571148 RepID=A0A4U0PYQ6_9NEIS|nr:PD-(D/E)XK nuclease family protein [Chitiniphilus eburneus]TJZ73771.1 PD-(D/E)XK nuclease family protein [Chitiniphilus eburneus]
MSDPIRVRASSWGRLFDCAHAWEGAHLLGMYQASGPRALLGTALHAATAVFDQARVDAAPVSVAEASDVLADVLREPPYEVSWAGEDLSPRQAMSIGQGLLGRYCTEISPRYQFTAVELATAPLTIDCGGGLQIELTGTMDRSRARIVDGAVGISDLKTGRNAVSQGRAATKGHVAQLGTYELLFEHTTGQVVTAPGEIIGMKTSGAPEIAAADVPNARALMVGTARQRGLIEFAAEMFRSGLFPPNPQSHACHERYCARWKACPYHD